MFMIILKISTIYSCFLYCLLFQVKGRELKHRQALLKFVLCKPAKQSSGVYEVPSPQWTRVRTTQLSHSERRPVARNGTQVLVIELR